MPEIAECYSIAEKIPELGKIESIEFSPHFYRDINKKKTITNKLQNYIFGKPFAYGKSIWIPISKDNKIGYIISQLGMTGSWSVNQRLEQRNEKHDHLKIKGSKFHIFYNDPRRFGKMNLYWGENFNDLKKYIIKENKWGLDPFISNELELAEQLNYRWEKRDQEIKKLLLEQNVIFGIGNYLASEVLFKSKLSPYLRPKDLNSKDYINLVKGIKFIIKKALDSGGFSFAGGYLLPDGSYGNYSKKVLIYGKDMCPICKEKLNKEYIASRITYWCENCQKT